MEHSLVLIAYSNPAKRKRLAQQLSGAGFETHTAGSYSDALNVLENIRPQLLLVDTDLQDRSGLDLAETVRNDPVNAGLGIVMCGTQSDEALRIKALDKGVDDFIARAVSDREFLARINATLRRVNHHPKPQKIVVGKLVLDLDSYLVMLDSKLLPFGPTEFRLLRFLMQNPNKVHSRDQLLEKVWHSDGSVGQRTVDVHVRRLRSALERQGYDVLIQTVTGVGYRFMPDAIETSLA